MSGKNNPQRQRSGAKILKSKKDAEKDEIRRLEKQLVKAADIEEQLAALATKKDDNRSYKLRSHLCEVLSDVLISNPQISLERDCFQRLWRGCFYNPIRIWRQRVSREKRKRSPTLATTQEGFKHFLDEAVTLYDYLVLQYLTKLVPSATQMEMTQQSFDTSRSQLEETQYATQSTISTEASLEGVVHGLYKLYIFLGDLHRYAEAYNKAETNYSNASKLGPGLGNPYNQLAVVAFSKDAYCVALYWYARSLLATHEKFSTSSSNLERLFSSNREHLKEHDRNSKPPIFVNNNGGGKQKNKNMPLVRQQKAAAIKSCLTYFVDLHYDLFQTQQGSANSSMDAEVGEKMKNIIASLRSFVLESGFSDALLCKIVVINSFSWERASNEGNNGNSLAREFMFSLGLILGEQVQKLLTKALPKAAPGKALPAVRGLLPFEMLLEFISIKDNSASTDIDRTSTEDEFWRCVAAVGSLVRNLLNVYKTTIAVKEGSYQNSTCITQIKEYQLLKGYRPFGVVNKHYLTNKDGFLNASEAVDILELSTTQSGTQDTCTVSAMSASTESSNRHESRVRLFRMLEICEYLAKPASCAPLLVENDVYLYQESSASSNTTMLESRDIEDEEYSNDGGDFDDDASDVVLYQAPNDAETGLPSNSGAIVPPKSGQGTDKNTNEEQKEIDITTTDVVMTVAEEQPPKQIPSLIKPPPGFGASTMLPSTSVPTASGFLNHQPSTLSYNPTIDLPGLSSQNKNRSILDQVVNGRESSVNSSTPPIQLPQQRDQSILPIPGLLPDSKLGTELLYPVHGGRSSLPTSVEESIRVFGDLKTANPFFVDPPPSAFTVQSNSHTVNTQQGYIQNSSIIPNFVPEEDYGTDDTKWLNSKLLDSLWMNDSNKTENMWVGK